MKIGGNVVAEVQVYEEVVNEIGEAEKVCKTIQTLKGFLDLRGGESEYEKFNTKMQESTHIFICDFVPLEKGVISKNGRLKVNDVIYDVMLIDNPLELGRHYEIYLKFIG